MYIILEIQEQEQGSVPATLTYTAETLDEAKSKYHSILQYAAASTIYRHSAVVIDTNGKYLARECYEHVPQTGEEVTA